MSDSTTLTININSFSYNRGLPYDSSGNGGGFVFDCRGILNPGKYERYMMLTGKDPEVKEFFRKNTNIDWFLEQTLKLVEFNAQTYIKRNFTHLMVSYGCTGGRHRSVYCAEWLAQRLKETESINVELTHQDLKQ